jgi:hypothetical protein
MSPNTMPSAENAATGRLDWIIGRSPLSMAVVVTPHLQEQ